MCFYYSDYDWEAAEVDENQPAADKPTHCYECNRTIEVGEQYLSIDMRQYEECRTCTEGECHCPKDEDGDCIGCKCEEPEVGETYHYQRCEDCTKLLKAIEAVEIANGCKGEETQPALERLHEAMIDEDGDAYEAKALEMFPDLAGHLKRFSKPTRLAREATGLTE